MIAVVEPVTELQKTIAENTPLTSGFSQWLIVAGITVLTALVVKFVAWRVLLRVLGNRNTGPTLRRQGAWPVRVVVVLTALLATLVPSSISTGPKRILIHATALALIAAVAWLLVRLLVVVEDVILRRQDISAPNNLRARRIQTQTGILRRVVGVVVVVLAASAMMLTFPAARTIGASLLASAGLAGLIAGIAARSALSNLIAGIQVAFAEPIRLEDVVVVEGEWGNIEEITLTYVVVRIWDKRRLILPTTYFVEQPFQNWTRNSAALLGTVFLHVDHTTPVQAVRDELHRALQASKRWSGEVWNLQVTNTTEQTAELRALMSADDAPTVWELRCEIRERLIDFLQREYPGGLPRLRVDSPAPHEQPALLPVDAVPVDPSGNR